MLKMKITAKHIGEIIKQIDSIRYDASHD